MKSVGVTQAEVDRLGYYGTKSYGKRAATANGGAAKKSSEPKNPVSAGTQNTQKPSAWQAFWDALKPPEDAADVMFGTVRPEEQGRVYNTLNTAGHQTTASYLNTLGFLLDEDTSGEETMADIMLGVPSVPNLRTGENIEVQPLVKEPEAVKRAKEKASDWAYGQAETFGTEAAESEARAKEGLGKVGRFVVDAGIAGAQMLGDAALNTVAPGAGLAAMGVRTFGSAAQEARQAGASMQEQFNYAMTRALAEVLSEKLFDVGKLFGGGAADDIVEKLVRKLAKSDLGRTVIRTLVSGAGEGTEEAVTDLLEPALKAIYDSGASAQESYLTPEGRKELVAQAGYDALVGGVLGVTGSSVGVLKGVDAQKNAVLRQQDNARLFNVEFDSSDTAQFQRLRRQGAARHGQTDGTPLLIDYAQRNSGESTVVNTDSAQKSNSNFPQGALNGPDAAAAGQTGAAQQAREPAAARNVPASQGATGNDSRAKAEESPLETWVRQHPPIDGTQLLVDYLLEHDTTPPRQTQPHQPTDGEWAFLSWLEKNGALNGPDTAAAGQTGAAQQATTDTAAQTQGSTANSLTGAVEDSIIKEDHISTDSSQQQGAAGESLNGIDGYIHGTRSFDEVIDDYARIYTETVNSNRQWKWDDDIPGAEHLSPQQRKMIKQWAVSKGYLPDVRVEKVKGKRYGYADFESAGVVKETLQLPESMWKLSERKQFKWLDEQIGGKMKGYTWHHTEFPGIMQLVPYGIHNITNHDGGCSAGMWSEGSRRKK